MRRLRIEAGPLLSEEDGDLFADQERVLTQLRKSIDDAQNVLETSEDDDSGTTRFNRILLLHGVSGVGKTSLYLTLRKADETRTMKNGAPIWLDPLELGVIQTAQNALSDLLALIESKIEEKAPKAHHPDTDRDDCMQQLRKIQNKISEIWDGAPKERAVRIGPQAFAAEVVGVSRERARMRRDLNRLIQRISKHIFNGQLMILPIDDIHEHPAVALDVLRLLRMIHAPALLVLAIGDIEVLKIIERAHALKEINMDSSARPDERMREQAEQQAVYAMEKTIPAAQRFELLPPDPVDDQRKLLDFRPKSELEESPTISDLLNDLLADHGVSLSADLRSDDPRLWLLKTSPRHLADIYMQLAGEKEKGMARKDKGRFVSDFIWRQLEVLIHKNGWSDDRISKLTQIVHPTTGQGEDIALELNNDLVSEPKLRRAKKKDGLVSVETPDRKSLRVFPTVQAWMRLLLDLVLKPTGSSVLNPLYVLVIAVKDQGAPQPPKGRPPRNLKKKKRNQKE